MISPRTAFKFLVLFWLSTAGIDSHTTQRAPSSSHEEPADDFNPFMELAAALGGAAGGNGGGGGAGALGGIVSLVGNLMQNQDSGKANGGGANNIGSIIAGVSSLFANGGAGGGGGGGFDPSIIGNVIEMFAGGNSDNGNNQRAKRGAATENSGPNWESMLDIAMTFMGNQNNGGGGGGQQKRRSADDNSVGGGLMSLLPMVMNVVNSFNSPEGEKIAAQHKDHAWILPPFLEKIHIIWDHFQQSELAQVLWVQTGLNKVFKGFTDREGKMDYPKLFKSLENQSFRRRWIKAATDYAADFANYIANPDVYMR